jgi:hypothetical protein
VGEDLLWYRLARKLKIPVQRLRQETSSSDFEGWFKFFAQERMNDANEFDPTHHYLAQIALEIVRLRAAIMRVKSTHLKLDHFLFKFGEKGATRGKRREQKQTSPEQRTQTSKAFWSLVCGNRIK